MRSDFKIRKVHAREVLDSRGNPTLEVELHTKTHFSRAAVPSGASTGVHEACELRDGGLRYNGKGVLKAVGHVNKEIKKEILGLDCRKQKDIDKLMMELDGTTNKTRLGANAILGVSLAAARLNANVSEKPLYSVLGKGKVLPVPCMNVINGGVHADNKLSFQEFMICPRGKTFSESLRIGSETYHTLKKEIARKYGKSSTNVGDEGGFAPNIKKVDDALKILERAIRKAGYEGKVKIAIDAAASEFFNKRTRRYFVDGKKKDFQKMMRLYEHIMESYPVFSIEDPFEQDDFLPYPILTGAAKKRKVQIVGDDLLVTNPNRIKMANQRKLCSALLLKVNQIGTLTESVDAARLATRFGWNVMVSHRSGETEDTFISDLVVALGTGQIKTGAPCRSERVAKYNQLLRIEEQLGKKAKLGNLR